MDKIISGNTYIGDSTYEKLDLFLKKYTCQYTNVEDLLLPEPMIIGGSKVRYINVVDNEDRIVASISSKEIISISELEVECLLCD